jgi:hypothetical protein
LAQVPAILLFFIWLPDNISCGVRIMKFLTV